MIKSKQKIGLDKFGWCSRLVYKPNTDMKNKYTLMGDTICNKREKLPIFTSEDIAEADLFLYQVCNAYNLAESGNGLHRINWFPTCYIYVKNAPIEWEKWGLDNIIKDDDIVWSRKFGRIKKVVMKCQYNNEMKYQYSWDAAPAILNYIEIDEIGSLN